MDQRKIVFQETGIVLAGEVICCGLMVAVFALLGKLELSVWLGALFGLILAVGNFFFMAVAASLAADKAVAQDVKGGKSMVKSSYFIRLAVLALLLFALAKSGLCNLLALVLPLLFVRPVINLSEFFRKKGDTVQ